MHVICNVEMFLSANLWTHDLYRAISDGFVWFTKSTVLSEDLTILSQLLV